jgi:hypothetical protein
MVTALMVEYLLKFMDKQNPEGKSILYFISLCPYGVSKEDLFSIFGSTWNECEILLKSKKVIHEFIPNVAKKDLASESTPQEYGPDFISESNKKSSIRRGRSVKKHFWVKLDPSIINIIGLKMTPDEINETDLKVVNQLVNIFESAKEEKHELVSR